MRYSSYQILKQKKWIFLFFLTLVILSKAPFFNLPLFSDEIPYIKGFWKTYQNNLNPFVEFRPYKPPLLYLLSALSYKIFGYSIVVPRLIAAFFSFLALCFTFLIGKELYNRKTGFWASLILFFSPIFFAQSGLILSAVPVTALTVSTLYFLIKGNKIGYFISAALLVLTKEPTLIIIGTIAAYEFLINLFDILKKPKWISSSYKVKKIILEPLFLLSPIAVFLIWMCLNKLLLGWFLWPKYAEYYFEGNRFSLFFIKRILNITFLKHYRWLISIPMIVELFFSLVFKGNGNRFFRREHIFFILLTLVTVLFFSWPPERFRPLARYYLYLYPFLFIFGSAAIIQIFRNRITHTIILTIIIGLFVSCWYVSVRPMMSDLNLTYRYEIKAHKEMAEFLERYFYSSRIVCADGCIRNELSDPKFGYVKKPFQGIFGIKNKQFSPRDLESYIAPKKLSVSEDRMIVVLTNRILWQIKYFVVKCFEDKGAKLLKVFESGDEKVNIYIMQTHPTEREL